MDLLTALAQLDPSNDEQWTAEGYPRVDVVSRLVGVEVSRRQITEANPTLMRNTAPELPPRDEDAPLLDLGQDEAGGVEEAPPAPPAEEVAPPEPVGESVLTMPTQQVVNDPELLARAIEEMSAIHDAKIEQIRALEKETKELAGKIETASIIFQRIKPKDDDTSGVREFLARQAEARAEKAKRARKFIDAGTSPQEVAKALDPRSQLDQAMNRRKAGMGSSRPAPRTPAGK